jgi:hypothetical protein
MPCLTNGPRSRRSPDAGNRRRGRTRWPGLPPGLTRWWSPPSSAPASAARCVPENPTQTCAPLHRQAASTMHQADSAIPVLRLQGGRVTPKTARRPAAIERADYSAAPPVWPRVAKWPSQQCPNPSCPSHPSPRTARHSPEKRDNETLPICRWLPKRRHVAVGGQ